MRPIIALISGCALLTAGCNSKRSEPQATEELSPAAASTDNKPVFRNRSASSPAGSNEMAAFKAATPTAKKRSALPAIATQNASAIAQADDNLNPAEESSETPPPEIRAEDIPQEGDEILVPPQMLGKLIPGANFDSIERQEPINIKALLEKTGFVLTNYQQLLEIGITNYQIVRAQRSVEGQGEK